MAGSQARRSQAVCLEPSQTRPQPPQVVDSLLQTLEAAHPRHNLRKGLHREQVFLAVNQLQVRLLHRRLLPVVGCLGVLPHRRPLLRQGHRRQQRLRSPGACLVLAWVRRQELQLHQPPRQLLACSVRRPSLLGTMLRRKSRPRLCSVPPQPLAHLSRLQLALRPLCLLPINLQLARPLALAEASSVPSRQ